MGLSEGLMGLLGVVGLFSLITVWCWIEGRMDRKRDQQRAVYDKWMRERVKKQ
jgi:hypothetical protein